NPAFPKSTPQTGLINPRIAQINPKRSHFPAPQIIQKINLNLEKRTAPLALTPPTVPACVYPRTLSSSSGKMAKSLLPIHYPNVQHYSTNKLHDRVWRTKKFRILSTTLLIFLSSLWAVANFSGAHFNFDTLRPYRNNAAAMAAVSALGEGGEEGIQALEVQTHEFLYGKGHHFGINDMFVDEEDDYDYEWGFWDSSRGKAKNEDKNLDKASE
ncbi:6902_t:CDS:1, partial [Paraglomus occultum]